MMLRVVGVVLASAAIILVSTVLPVVRYSTRIGRHAYVVRYSAVSIKHLSPAATHVPCAPRDRFDLRRTCLDPGCGTNPEVCGRLPAVDGRRRCRKKQHYCVQTTADAPATSLLSVPDRALAAAGFAYVHDSVSTCRAPDNSTLAFLNDPAFGGLRCDGTPQCAAGEDEAGCSTTVCAAGDGSGAIEHAANDPNQTRCAHACADVAFTETFSCGGSSYCALPSAVCSVYKTTCRRTYRQNPVCRATDSAIFASEPDHPEKPCAAAAKIIDRADGLIAATVTTAVLAVAAELGSLRLRRYRPVAAAMLAAAAAVVWNGLIRPAVDANRECRPARSDVRIHPAAGALTAIAVAVSISLSAYKGL